MFAVNYSCYCPYQVERNVLDVSYHVSQYRTIISELREEIARLRAKMKEDRPRSGNTSNDKAEKLKLLRDKIVSTFRDQMRLRSASCEVVTTVQLKISLLLKCGAVSLDNRIPPCQGNRKYKINCSWAFRHLKMRKSCCLETSEFGYPMTYQHIKKCNS